jgi:hypothetical protein
VNKGLVLLTAILLLLGTGCDAIDNHAQRAADLAEAERIATEAEANERKIQAEAEAAAKLTQAQAFADAERARGEATRIQAQADKDRAASEIQRALGDRAISEAVAGQVDANSEFIRAQATVERAQASQYKANTWAIYALAGAGLLMIVGVALRLILAGIADVSELRRDHRIIEYQQQPTHQLPRSTLVAAQLVPQRDSRRHQLERMDADG